MDLYHYLFKFIIVGDTSRNLLNIDSTPFRCRKILYFDELYREKIPRRTWYNHWCRIWLLTV